MGGGVEWTKGGRKGNNNNVSRNQSEIVLAVGIYRYLAENTTAVNIFILLINNKSLATLIIPSLR